MRRTLHRCEPLAAQKGPAERRKAGRLQEDIVGVRFIRIEHLIPCPYIVYVLMLRLTSYEQAIAEGMVRRRVPSENVAPLPPVLHFVVLRLIHRYALPF